MGEKEDFQLEGLEVNSDNAAGKKKAGYPWRAGETNIRRSQRKNDQHHLLRSRRKAAGGGGDNRTFTPPEKNRLRQTISSKEGEKLQIRLAANISLTQHGGGRCLLESGGIDKETSCACRELSCRDKFFAWGGKEVSNESKHPCSARKKMWGEKSALELD